MRLCMSLNELRSFQCGLGLKSFPSRENDVVKVGPKKCEQHVGHAWSPMLASPLVVNIRRICLVRTTNDWLLRNKDLNHQISILKLWELKHWIKIGILRSCLKKKKKKKKKTYKIPIMVLYSVTEGKALALSAVGTWFLVCIFIV